MSVRKLTDIFTTAKGVVKTSVIAVASLVKACFMLHQCGNRINVV